MPPNQLMLLISSFDTTILGTDVEQAPRRSMCHKLKCLDNLSVWLAAEPKKQDAMDQQNMNAMLSILSLMCTQRQ